MFTSGLVRIGNEPVLRYTASNDPVIELNLAYNYGRKDENGKYPTQWINATLWGSRAEKLANHLTKGKQLFVVLSDLHNESYTKKDGGQGTSLRAKVTDLQFVDTRQEEPKAKATSFDDFDDKPPF